MQLRPRGVPLCYTCVNAECRIEWVGIDPANGEHPRRTVGLVDVPKVNERHKHWHTDKPKVVECVQGVLLRGKCITASDHHDHHDQLNSNGNRPIPCCSSSRGDSEPSWEDSDNGRTRSTEGLAKSICVHESHFLTRPAVVIVPHSLVTPCGCGTYRRKSECSEFGRTGRPFSVPSICHTTTTTIAAKRCPSSRDSAFLWTFIPRSNSPFGLP